MDKKDAHRREHRKGKRNITPVPLFRSFQNRSVHSFLFSFYFSFYFCNGFHDNLCYNPQDQKMLEQNLVLFISGA